MAKDPIDDPLDDPLARRARQGRKILGPGEVIYVQGLHVEFYGVLTDAEARVIAERIVAEFGDVLAVTAEFYPRVYARRQV